LTSEEISYLFEGLKAVEYMLQNSVTLHRDIEIAFDSGAIVIIPIPSAEIKKTRWKCVLTNQTKRDQTCIILPMGGSDVKEIKWRDLDEKELVFFIK